ncbi:MAG: hypothetical protein E7292_12880 [Lachnospiraceae bacterium]|nr:hypothetical protein [Lachnospiraceae bacterium]
MIKKIAVFKIPVFLLGALGLMWGAIGAISNVLMNSIDDTGPKARLYWNIVDIWYWVVVGISFAFLLSVTRVLFKELVKCHMVIKIIFFMLTVVGWWIHWFGAFVVYKGGFF